MFAAGLPSQDMRITKANKEQKTRSGKKIYSEPPWNVVLVYVPRYKTP
jgi:hypothetical protein